MTARSDRSESSVLQTGRQKPMGAWKYITIGSFILLYYGISMTLSIFNKHVLGRNRMNFPFPLFAALIYDIIQFLLAVVIMSALAAGSKKKDAVGPWKAYQQLGADKYWKIILPCAIAAGLDISLSNSSLKYVSLSFYTMVKSSSPMFILIFAFVFRLEKLSWALGGIVGVIGLGTLLTVYNPESFDALGFALVFSAAIMSGIRWALTQLIIENRTAKTEDSKSADGPLSAILFLTPTIGATLVLLCGVFEGFLSVGQTLLVDLKTLLQAGFICAFGGVMTFALILTEYKVVESTSVITLSISGIVKEILMIAVSVVYFKDKLLPINYAGLAISIAGIIGYNWYKIRRSRGKRVAQTMVGGDMYFAVPTSENSPYFINPFEEADDDDEESVEYIELEGQKRQSRSLLSSRNASKENIGSKSMGNLSIVSEAEECFNTLKSDWSSLPALDYYPSPGVTNASAPNQRPSHSNLEHPS